MKEVGYTLLAVALVGGGYLLVKRYQEQKAVEEALAIQEDVIGASLASLEARSSSSSSEKSGLSSIPVIGGLYDLVGDIF